MVERIAVHGASGSGKTTLALALSDRLGIPHTELDAHFHQPGWTPLDADAFRARVGDVVAGSRWVVDGNYHQVRDLVWARAQLIVVLDPPRRTVIGQLTRRTVGRAVTRRELWNGNRESLRNMVSTDPERNIILWSWRTGHHYHEEIPMMARAEAPHAAVEVVRSRRQAALLLEQLSATD